MADLMPDYRVSQQKLKAEIAHLEARIESHKLELLELVSRRESILSNWDSEVDAIGKKKADLKSLEDSHGPVTEVEVSESRATDLTGGRA